MTQLHGVARCMAEVTRPVSAYERGASPGSPNFACISLEIRVWMGADALGRWSSRRGAVVAIRKTFISEGNGEIMKASRGFRVETSRSLCGIAAVPSGPLIITNYPATGLRPGEPFEDCQLPVGSARSRALLDFVRPLESGPPPVPLSRTLLDGVIGPHHPRFPCETESARTHGHVDGYSLPRASTD